MFLTKIAFPKRASWFWKKWYEWMLCIAVTVCLVILERQLHFGNSCKKGKIRNYQPAQRFACDLESLKKYSFLSRISIINRSARPTNGKIVGLPTSLGDNETPWEIISEFQCFSQVVRCICRGYPHGWSIRVVTVTVKKNSINGVRNGWSCNGSACSTDQLSINIDQCIL